MKLTKPEKRLRFADNELINKESNTYNQAIDLYEAYHNQKMGRLKENAINYVQEKVEEIERLKEELKDVCAEREPLKVHCEKVMSQRDRLKGDIIELKEEIILLRGVITLLNGLLKEAGEKLPSEEEIKDIIKTEDVKSVEVSYDEATLNLAKAISKRIRGG